jgi:(R,R)-butanediol dehydrogenase/meso-butanediol dehydrogenase/diacetyl reductase
VQCNVLAAIGAAADGAFAEYAVVRQDCLHPLPENVSFEAGAYAEPLACGIRAVNRSGLRPGAIVAVVGAGPIGLLTLQAAIACGASSAYVFEIAPQRRGIAQELGATEVFDPCDAGLGKKFTTLTKGLRADIAFECSGTVEGMLLADSLTGRGGVIVSAGVISEPVKLSFLNLFLREKAIITSQGYVNEEFEAAVRFLAAGRVRTDPLLTSKKIHLGEILEKGFGELASARRHEHCKILVSPES